MINKHYKWIEVSQREFNKHLNITKAYKNINGLYIDEKIKHQKYTRWLKVNNINVFLTYKIGKKQVNVKTNLSQDYTEDIIEIVDPIRAYGAFARLVHPENYDYESTLLPGLGHYKNHHIDKIGYYENVYVYDVNKAFFNACNNLMPINLLRQFDCPKINEVGFTLNGMPVIGPSKIVCRFVFSLGKHEGLTKYIETYSKHLLNAESDKEKSYYKQCINLSIGCLRKHNVFMYNMIVYYSNEYIKSKVDENTIWSNTDSIVSTVARNDLDIGTKIGQFKIEYQGRFIQNGTGYQKLDIEDGLKYNGVSKSNIKNFKIKYGHDFILGQDNIAELNKLKTWRYNYETEQIEKVQISSL